jgi:hypothetical protein
MIISSEYPELQGRTFESVEACKEAEDLIDKSNAANTCNCGENCKCKEKESKSKELETAINEAYADLEKANAHYRQVEKENYEKIKKCQEECIRANREAVSNIRLAKARVRKLVEDYCLSVLFD